MRITVLLIGLVVFFLLWKNIAPKSTTTPTIDFDKAIVIDVRSPEEFAGGHIKNAVNLPIDTITEAELLSLASKDQPIVLYCHSGGRASMVHRRMTDWGFSTVYNLKTQSGVKNAMNLP